MKIERVWGVWFSPTGSTETLVRAAADSLAGVLDVPVSYRSLNTPVQRQEPLCLGPQELLIVGGPTYAGKLPNKIMPAFRELLRGEKTPAVAVVTFGNRSFDNALAELGAILSEKGFEIVGAAACAAEHAMARSLAAGRPDAEDLDRMTRFCAELGTGLAAAKQLPDPPQIPGDAAAPYYRPLRADGAPANFLRAKPKTDPVRCDRCGLCACLCTMGAIETEDPMQVTGTCIKCQACVQHCPTGAKYFDDPDYLSHLEMLRAHYAAPADSVYFPPYF